MRHRALIAVVVLAAACQSPGPTPGPTGSSTTPEELRAQADAHFAQQRYDAAVTAYREVLGTDDRNVAVRHRLAVALAHLGRADEATEAFRSVVEMAPPNSDEARIARQWLVEREGPRQAVAAATVAPAAEETIGSGRVEGKTEWNLDPSHVRPSLQLLLQGDDPGTQNRRYWARTSLGEAYSFEGVVPGRYRLTAQVGPIRLWDTRVSVLGSGPTAVDLTPRTSVAPPQALHPR